MISPVPLMGPTSGTPVGVCDRISAFGVETAPVAPVLREMS